MGSTPSTNIMFFSAVIFACMQATAQSQTNWVDSKLIEYNSDGAWAWFQDERAVVDTAGEKLIIGSANTKSSVDITIFDLKKEEVASSTRFNPLRYLDDHNAPAVMVAPGGAYIAMWAHHYDEYDSHYSIYDNNAWSAEQTFDWTTIPGGTDYTIAYSNLCYLSGENRIYNLTRANDRAPNLICSGDSGRTWEFCGQLVTGSDSAANKGYFKYWGDGTDRIDFVFTQGHPRDRTTSIYHGYMRDNKTYTTFGDLVDGDVADRAFIPLFDAFTTVFEHGTRVNNIQMGRCWQHDLVRYRDGIIAVLFQARANNSETDHRNFYARFDGKEWKTTYIGKAGPPQYSSEQDYTGLGALNPDDPSRIYISSPYDPGNDNKQTAKREIWRGTTADHGATWQWEPVTANSSEDNIRPIVPQWKPGKEALLWCRGTYNSASIYYLKIVGTLYDYDITPIAGQNRKSPGPAGSQAGHDKITVQQGPHRVLIEYAMQERAPVMMQVYSVTGRKITTLAGSLTARGHWRVIWPTRGVPSGVYFAGIHTGDRVQTEYVTVHR
jgi:hypothetical protein